MRIGTRKSKMALAQTQDVARRIKAAVAGCAPEVVPFQTQGDADQTSKLGVHGGKGGAFVAEIRAAILAGRLEAAMHSLKDMPGNEETPGLVIGAYIERDDPRDALVTRPGLTFDDLNRDPARYTIGTNSVRRAAFLRTLFPGADVIHFRGAADTRIRKLDQGEMQKTPDGGTVGPADALVLAAAGLRRVGLGERIEHIFGEDEMLPAVGQGIVAVECADADWQTMQALAAVSDDRSRTCATAEREVLWVLDGHCNSPIAGHARFADGSLHLAAAVMSIDGTQMVTHESSGDPARPRELGRAVGLALLQRGAGELIEQSFEP